jgi:hypothetical protein
MMQAKTRERSMAFGEPRLGPFLVYATIAAAGVCGLAFGGSVAVRVASVAVLLGGLLLLLITHHWRLLLPPRRPPEWARRGDDDDGESSASGAGAEETSSNDVPGHRP